MKKSFFLKMANPVDQFISSRKTGQLLKVGDKAPEFSVSTHEGQSVSLSQHLGKRVVLYFYPKADTPGCTAQGCALRDQFPEIKGKDSIILGVSFDDIEGNRKFAEKFNFPFPLLCDTDRKIGLAYGACKSAKDGFPARIAYIIDPEGHISHVFDKVDAQTFAEVVVNAL